MLDVLCSEDRFAVVAKPAGLMVHDSQLARGETEFAADHLRAQFGRPVYLVHRLDRATSGCLLLAFDREAAGILGRAVMAQALGKDYLAVARGWPSGDFVVDHPLDGGPGKPQKKPAVTDFALLATGALAEPAGGFDSARFCLLRASPRSGRFRQIRRHLKHAGHHLVGDTSHGDGQRNRIFRMRGIHRMLLHAWRLRFPHPESGAEVAVQAPLDAPFRRALGLFGWALPD